MFHYMNQINFMKTMMTIQKNHALHSYFSYSKLYLDLSCLSIIYQVLFGIHPVWCVFWCSKCGSFFNLNISLICQDRDREPWRQWGQCFSFRFGIKFAVSVRWAKHGNFVTASCSWSTQKCWLFRERFWRNEPVGDGHLVETEYGTLEKLAKNVSKIIQKSDYTEVSLSFY